MNPKHLLNSWYATLPANLHHVPISYINKARTGLKKILLDKAKNRKEAIKKLAVAPDLMSMTPKEVESL